MRKPFQGVGNIIRFNWHFYALSMMVLLSLFILSIYTDSSIDRFLLIIGLLIVLPTIVSLAVSYYIYDLSDFYTFNWIDKCSSNSTIVNINAGFDETSIFLKVKFPSANLMVFDFYDPNINTEISIKRARKAYPSFLHTQTISSSNLPMNDHSADKIFVLFSAHEIRSPELRTAFFKELERVLKPTGEIFITEHLRDLPNFLAYTIGFLHFYSKQTWLQTFESARLSLKNEQKITPFISTFTLTKYGVAS